MAKAKEDTAPQAEVVSEAAEQTPEPDSPPRVRIRIEGWMEIDLADYPGAENTDEAAAVDQSAYDTDEVGVVDVFSWIDPSSVTVTFEGVQ